LFQNLWAKAETGFLLSAQKINLNNLFFSLILFFPTQLGLHFWPQFAKVEGVRIDYLSPTLYVTDLLILFLFLSWVISQKKFSISNFQIIFAAFIIIGIIFSKSLGAGLYGLLKFLEFIFLGFYVSNIKNLKLRNILFLLSLGIIFESFLALSQYLNQGSLGGLFYFFGERMFNPQTPGIANASINGQLILRPYGTFPHPNVLAGYLVIVMTLIIFNCKKILYSLTLLIGTVALFLTLSRVAIILWVLILGFFLIRKFIILALVSLLLFVLITPLGLRFTGMRLTDESIVIREELAKSSLLMIKKSPLLGVGINNFLVNLPNTQKSNNSSLVIQPVHNIFLLVLSETGIVGFYFFVWFLIKTYQNIRFGKNYLIIYPLSLILILGMFDHYFLTLQQGQLLFSFILGLCWSKKSHLG